DVAAHTRDATELQLDRSLAQREADLLVPGRRRRERLFGTLEVSAHALERAANVEGRALVEQRAALLGELERAVDQRLCALDVEAVDVAVGEHVGRDRLEILALRLARQRQRLFRERLDLVDRSEPAADQCASEQR